MCTTMHDYVHIWYKYLGSESTVQFIIKGKWAITKLFVTDKHGKYIVLNKNQQEDSKSEPVVIKSLVQIYY